MIDRFLLCRRCAAVLAVLDVGRLPDEAADAAAESAAFTLAHTAHGIDTATRLDDRALVDAPVWDPMATRWFQVAAGGERLTVRSWRNALDEPRQYEVAHARPPASHTYVEVDEALLRRALDRHFYPHVIRAAQIDAFVASVRELLEPLEADRIAIAFDDARLPDTGIGPLPAPVIGALLVRCEEQFAGFELDRARSFVTDHAPEDGALAVRVRRVMAPRAA